MHWAHRRAGRFPDGQLFADLRGFDGSFAPARPDEVLLGFLTALGVPPERVPSDVGAQVGLYRSLLAGRRVLILLDNARRADQVRPLLPGSAGCLVVVTSRHHLSGLVAAGARPVDLGLMTDAEARRLLTSRIEPERVAAAPEAVDELVAACARLPLALAIVAARAGIQPRLPLAALTRQLRAGPGDLAGFADEDEAFDVRTVLSWSYRLLTPDAAALFRMLGVHPGPDICVAAAAALAGVSDDRARRLLAHLARASLVIEYPSGRLGCHDLLRAFAAELAGSVDTEVARRAALRRVLDHYVASARTADRLISPFRDAGAPASPRQPAGAPSPAVVGQGDTAGAPTDVDSALSWFTTEYPVLLAMIDGATAAGFDQAVCDLAWHLTTFLDRRGRWSEQALVQRSALIAADRLGDRSVRARTHRNLARAYSRLGRHADARDQLRQALLHYEALGDDAGRANTMMSLADSCERQGRYRDALAHAERALALYTAAGYGPGQANALNAVGWCHALLGDHPRAVAHCGRALRLHRSLADRRGEADTWDSIGYANHGLARYRPAARCFERAVALFRDVGDRFAEATSLVRLGDTRLAMGELSAARDDWSRAVSILTELGHPDADDVRDRLVAPALSGTVPPAPVVARRQRG